MHDNRLNICRKIFVDRLEFLKDISASSADQWRIFTWLDEVDQDHSMLQIISRLSTERVVACLAIGRWGFCIKYHL